MSYKFTSADLPPTPDPLAVARRYAEVTGQAAFSPDTLYPGTATTAAEFAILYADRYEPQPADQAVVAVTRQDQMGQSMRPDLAPIGEYDPGQLGWQLYPEYVNYAYHETLATYLEVLAAVVMTRKNERAVTGSPEIDLRHPLTTKSRERMTRTLGALPPHVLLDKAHAASGSADPVPRADEYTAVYPSVATVGEGQPAWPEAPGGDRLVLWLCYSGLKLSLPGGFSQRARQAVPVASAPVDKPDAWQRRDIVTQQEWETLQQIPPILLGYANRHSAFSAAYCAVIHN